MSNPPQATLPQLNTKQRQLQQLQEEAARIEAFMGNLQHQARELAQLNTSAREAQNKRLAQQSGMTIPQQIQKYRKELEEITDQMMEVRDAIVQLSYSQIQSNSSASLIW
ncbi:hypothetical protein EMCG_02522 [[Emmonsia] crescens]|uniref:Uncharacterized protein n=1 Tax=[Emmonsia] crescens TaxID=73230 RepID=A0A0G2HZ71_9EURO|nr:hypothetical protein EMCG_02522 [Emmonsia crescens UAMH 3008]